MTKRRKDADVMCDGPIVAYWHCARCQDENRAPQEEDKSVGLTKEGDVVVWCEIHNSLIAGPLKLKDPPNESEFICGTCERQARDH